tara:strand:+ start:30608 stop:31027 length:420 start_codon:yes stop_codon:yes gene_type:complete
MSSESRVPAGQPTGGQFALNVRPEALVELAKLIGPPICVVCGSPDVDDSFSERCDSCIDSGAELCSECHESYNGDGDGYNGMCGDCADRAEGPWCSECGERMRVNSDGTSVHLDDDGNPQLGEDDPGHAALLDDSREYI